MNQNFLKYGGQRLYFLSVVPHELHATNVKLLLSDI